MHTYCRIIGCRNPATAGTDKGLNRKYCRSHEDHCERHGSYTKGSYRLVDIRPHRTRALKWLKEHHDDPSVIRAVAKVERLYHQAGAKVEAFRLRGLKPQERAWAAWARLREAGIGPLRPLAAWLAIELTIRADIQPESKSEYKRVQAAKLIHRMASGSHKTWERQRSDGKTMVEEMHRYPHSRGRVLRHIGEQLEGVVDQLHERYLTQSQVSTLST